MSVSGGGTVDKFGRMLGVNGNATQMYETTRYRLRGPKGDGFVLEKDGNFSVENKRIKSMHDPLEDQDGVTKKYLHTNFLGNFQKDYISVGGKRVSNLFLEPKDQSDVVSKYYVDKKCNSLKADILSELQTKLLDISKKKKG
mgnify:CR=1 FL=1